MSVLDNYVNSIQSQKSLDVGAIGSFESPAITAAPTNNKQNVFGHTIEFIESITSSSHNIDNVTVESSADVAFGNRIFFIQSMANGPNGINTLLEESSEQFFGIQKLYRKNRLFVCWISTVFSVIMAALVVMVCFSHIFERMDEPSACEEIDSVPSYLTCGYASSCTECSTLYPGNEICQSYYTGNCGEVRCFCKPGCASQDCQH